MLFIDYHTRLFVFLSNPLFILSPSITCRLTPLNNTILTILYRSELIDIVTC